MKIRVMGTESECQAAREYYRELEKGSNVKSVSISENYANRGSNTILRDMKESTKDGAFVQMGAYWYEVQDLTKSIEAIKEAIEEAENEEAG